MKLLEKRFMARVITEKGQEDLNELNEGYSIYFNDRKTAYGSLKAYLMRSPKYDYGYVIQLLNGGHYKTTDKIGY